MKTLFKLFWITLIVISIFSSCTKDEDPIFSESPTERVNKTKSELSKLLLAEEQGYKGIYFSKNDEYGGATFYFKFNDDGTVKSTSDFDSETDLELTSYRVSLGTTATELVFEDRGHIQKMSNPSLQGLRGVGFKGTSVFQYFGNENGALKFRDIRNKDTGFLTLFPTGFSDFKKESVESVKKSLAERKEFITSAQVTAFPFLTAKTSNSDLSYDLNYDALRFFAKPSKKEKDGSISEIIAGFLFTEEGLIVSPPIEVDGVSFEEFKKDTSNGLKYVSTVDGATAAIGYGMTPATPLDAYAFGVRRNIAFNNHYEPNKFSASFNKFYKDFTGNLANNYNVIINWYGLIDLKGNLPYLLIVTNYGRIWFGISFTVKDGIVKFSLTGSTNASAETKAILQPFLDVILLAPQGYYLKKTGGLPDYSNRTFSMINVADPTMWFNYFDY